MEKQKKNSRLYGGRETETGLAIKHDSGRVQERCSRFGTAKRGARRARRYCRPWTTARRRGQLGCDYSCLRAAACRARDQGGGRSEHARVVVVWGSGSEGEVNGGGGAVRVSKYLGSRYRDEGDCCVFSTPKPTSTQHTPSGYRDGAAPGQASWPDAAGCRCRFVPRAPSRAVHSRGPAFPASSETPRSGLRVMTLCAQFIISPGLSA